MIEAWRSGFVDDLARSVEALRQAYGVDDLVRARKARTLPKDGGVDGVVFEFHGKGVRFDLGDRLVDVDFCTKGVEVDWFRFKYYLPETVDVQELRTRYLQTLEAANAESSTAAGLRVYWRA